MLKPPASTLVLAAIAAFPLATADAQGWLEKAKQKAKEKVEQQVDKATAETPVARPAASTGGGATATPAVNSSSSSSGSANPGEGVWANYDFKPGDRVLYFDDFTKDEVGDFPRRMEFKEGAVEIVQAQGKRWLRATNDSRFSIVLPEVLPARFTMEFDFTVPAGTMWLYFGGDQNKRVMLSTYYGLAEVYNASKGVHAKVNFAGDSREDRAVVHRARILADGGYFKVYIGDRRVLNVPNADMERSGKIHFWADGDPDHPALVADIRIAAGGRKLYETLAQNGRVSTQGIYFDTGSERIRPESTPTLREIAAMLSEHPELKLTIEGHTDDVGAAAANQALSEKRASAVKALLVSSFGADAGRLEAKGLGAAKPAIAGATPEARQQNRRVELVKM